MDTLGRPLAKAKSLASRKRVTAGIAALLIVGGSGAALLARDAQLQQRRRERKKADR